MAAIRKPLVFEQGEIIEQKSGDSLDLNQGIVKAPTTLDDGTINRNLRDLVGDVIDVRNYGAKGDGVTDDTAAFNKAAADATNKGGVVYVPHGTYKITEIIPGQFISFGHPTFIGDKTVTDVMDKQLTDLYNDYVHKIKNVAETIDGVKTFSESPLVPTPAAKDNSKKAMNTEWLRNAVSGDSTGLSFDNNGKLKVDPSGMSKEAIEALVKSLLPDPGTSPHDGLKTDEDGKLTVDPSELIPGTGKDGLVVENGKLKVKPSELAGTGLNADDANGKLSVDVNDLIAGGNADGFEVTSAGKLKVKPGEFSSDIADAIVGSGLEVKDGKLVVDFSGLNDPNKTAAQKKAIQEMLNNLMKSLNLPIWLSKTTHFYVDYNKRVTTTNDQGETVVTHPNNVDDGVHGRSLENAWSTIDFATTTIAKNYNINSQKVYIHIVPGTYREDVNLPQQTRTTGFVMLAPTTQNGVVIIEHEGVGGSVINHTAGRWILNQLTLRYTIKDNTGNGDTTPNIINCTSADATLGIRRCNFSFIDNALVTLPEGNDSSGTPLANKYKNVNLRCIECNGGRISWNNMSVTSDAFDYHAADPDKDITANLANPVSTLSGTKSGARSHVTWIYVQNGGLLNFGTSDDTTNEKKFTSDTPTIQVSGTYGIFLRAITQGIVRSTGTGNKVAFTGSPTGKKYEVETGAIVTGFASKLPGSAAGDPVSATIPGYIS